MGKRLNRKPSRRDVFYVYRYGKKKVKIVLMSGVPYSGLESSVNLFSRKKRLSPEDVLKIDGLPDDLRRVCLENPSYIYSVDPFGEEQIYYERQKTKSDRRHLSHFLL